MVGRSSFYWSFTIISLILIYNSVQELQIQVDSNSGKHPYQNAIDGDNSTFWMSAASAPLPHWAIIELGSSMNINGFTYLPRQDKAQAGTVGQYEVELSSDKNTWTSVARGTFLDDSSLKIAGFETSPTRYIRFTAMTEAGDRGPWTSASEFGFLEPLSSNHQGEWGPVIPFPLVPAAALLDIETGNIITFSSASRNQVPQGLEGTTWIATYDIQTGMVSGAGSAGVNHDMFCPGMSVDFQGQVIVTGGNNTRTVSLWNPSVAEWWADASMILPRAYQSQVTCSDGRIFVIGGSWATPTDVSKDGEILDPESNAWKALDGCKVKPMLTQDWDKQRRDNHGWLFAWKDNWVFQAGPSNAMNWYDTKANGSHLSAGTRLTDVDSMCGNAVMYDVDLKTGQGFVLALGGSPSYYKRDATNNVYLITINTPGEQVTVQEIKNMTSPRMYANSVVLPTGIVFVVGGETYGKLFSDAWSVMIPEMWDPITKEFTPLPPLEVPRNYHSVALLMTDGRIFVGGGGLCGPTCGTNQENGQIFSPSYLFDSDGNTAIRPKIMAINRDTLELGSTFTVTTDADIKSFVVLRYGSATHSINTDQRRVPLVPASINGHDYEIKVPEDPGIMIRGYWMLFAMNEQGVPSLSHKMKFM